MEIRDRIDENTIYQIKLNDSLIRAWIETGKGEWQVCYSIDNGPVHVLHGGNPNIDHGFWLLRGMLTLADIAAEKESAAR